MGMFEKEKMTMVICDFHERCSVHKNCSQMRNYVDILKMHVTGHHVHIAIQMTLALFY